jgi:hypothetical protein
MQDFQKNSRITACLNKEIIGIGCKNRIYVSTNFDRRKKLLAKENENGEFIDG